MKLHLMIRIVRIVFVPVFLLFIYRLDVRCHSHLKLTNLIRCGLKLSLDLITPSIKSLFGLGMRVEMMKPQNSILCCDSFVWFVILWIVVEMFVCVYFLLLYFSVSFFEIFDDIFCRFTQTQDCTSQFQPCFFFVDRRTLNILSSMFFYLIFVLFCYSVFFPHFIYGVTKIEWLASAPRHTTP